MAREALVPAAEVLAQLIDLIDDELMNGVRSFVLKQGVVTDTQKVFADVNFVWTSTRNLTPILKKMPPNDFGYVEGLNGPAERNWWKIMNSAELIQNEKEYRILSKIPHLTSLEIDADAELYLIEIRTPDHYGCNWNFKPSATLEDQLQCEVCKRKRRFWVALKHVYRLLTEEALWVIKDLGCYGTWPGWEFSKHYAYSLHLVTNTETGEEYIGHLLRDHDDIDPTWHIPILDEVQKTIRQHHDCAKAFKSVRTVPYAKLPAVWQPVLALSTLLGFCIHPDFEYEGDGVRHMGLWERQGVTQASFHNGLETNGKISRKARHRTASQGYLRTHALTKNKDKDKPLPEAYTATWLSALKRLPKTRPLDFFDQTQWTEFRGNTDPGEKHSKKWYRSDRPREPGEYGLVTGLLSSAAGEYDTELELWDFDPGQLQEPHIYSKDVIQDILPCSIFGEGLHTGLSVRDHILRNPFGFLTVERRLRNGNYDEEGPIFLPRPPTWLVTQDDALIKDAQCVWELPDCLGRKNISLPHTDPDAVYACCAPRRDRGNNECSDLEDCENWHESFVKKELADHPEISYVHSRHPESQNCFCQDDVHSQFGWPCGAGNDRRQLPDGTDDHRGSCSAYFAREHLVAQQTKAEVLEGRLVHWCRRDQWMYREPVHIVPIENSPAVRYIEGHVPFVIALFKTMVRDTHGRVMLEPVSHRRIFPKLGADEVAGFADNLGWRTQWYLCDFERYFGNGNYNGKGPSYLTKLARDMFGYPTPRLEELWDVMKWMSVPNMRIFVIKEQGPYGPEFFNCPLDLLERRLPSEYIHQFDTFRESFTMPHEHVRKHDTPATPLNQNPLFDL